MTGDDREYVWAVWLRDKAVGEEVQSLQLAAGIEGMNLVGQGSFPVLSGLDPTASFEIRDAGRIEKILYHIRRDDEEADAVRHVSEAEQLMTKIRAAVEDNLAAHDITLRTARAVSFSVSHFQALFKDMTGEAFMSYVRKYRLSRARLLIRMSSSTLSEIGEKVGYPNPSYFSTVYKQHFGLTPREERENLYRLTSRG